MSHFCCVVIMEPEADEVARYERLTELLAPFDEQGEWGSEGTHWDYWMIGGRWDGVIRGLPPLEIKEKCIICGGTGTRKDLETTLFWPEMNEEARKEWLEQTKGCNGCMGTGLQEAWPSGPLFKSWERNSCQVKEIAEEFSPYAFINPKGEWIAHGEMGWFGITVAGSADGWEVSPDGLTDWKRALLAYPDHLAVAVDCHV